MKILNFIRIIVFLNVGFYLIYKDHPGWGIFALVIGLGMFTVKPTIEKFKENE